MLTQKPKKRLSICESKKQQNFPKNGIFKIPLEKKLKIKILFFSFFDSSGGFKFQFLKQKEKRSNKSDSQTPPDRNVYSRFFIKKKLNFFQQIKILKKLYFSNIGNFSQNTIKCIKNSTNIVFCGQVFKNSIKEKIGKKGHTQLKINNMKNYLKNIESLF